MKKLYIFTIFLMATHYLGAQDVQDILRFSRVNPYGTARSTAMGGAFGALGGDISTLHTNPAGIAVYRRSEFNFTPLLNFNKIESGNIHNNQNAFQLGTLGFVISFDNNKSDWKGFNIGFNYNQMNNFNRKMDQEVIGSVNSLLDAYAYQRNNYGSSLFTDLAEDINVIYYSPKDGAFVGALAGEDLNNGTAAERVDQFNFIEESGYQGEFAFSFGANYKDKLYLGFTLGLQSVYYKKYTTYAEWTEFVEPATLDYFDLMDFEKFDGVGTNLKFGLIYRPIPQIRIGAAIHTPTWYNIDYTYETDMYSRFFDVRNADYTGEEKWAWSPTYRWDYNMQTPWRAILSLATVLNQKAILSMDYEFVDYKSSKYKDSREFGEINRAIDNLLQSGHNVRFGAEYRFNSLFSLRGGYSFQNSPYKESGSNLAYYISGGDKIQTFSGGFGLNFGSFYCDAAYLYKKGKDTTIFYDFGDPTTKDYYTSAPINNNFLNHEARLTLGVRF